MSDPRPVDPRDRRRPRSVYEDGDEPDPRFSLANERTFLAWVRTALAFMAAGLAVEALEVPLGRALRAGVAVVLVALGIAAAAQAWLGWSGTERAMRRGTPLPSAGAKLPIAVVLVGVGVAVVAGMLR